MRHSLSDVLHRTVVKNPDKPPNYSHPKKLLVKELIDVLFATLSGNNPGFRRPVISGESPASRGPQSLSKRKAGGLSDRVRQGLPFLLLMLYIIIPTVESILSVLKVVTSVVFVGRGFVKLRPRLT